MEEFEREIERIETPQITEKVMLDLIPKELLMNPYDFILNHYEKLFPNIGRRVFSVLSLLPISLIIPKYTINGRAIRSHLNLLWLSPPGFCKSQISEQFSRITFNPLQTKKMTTPRLYHEFKAMKDKKISLIVEDIAIWFMDEEKIKFLEGASGEEECIFENSLIPLTNGDIKKVKDIKIGDNIFSINNNYDIEEKKVVHISSRISNDNLKIRTRTSELIVTPNHKFILLNNGEWVERMAQDLRIGDKLPIPVKIDCKTCNQSVRNEELESKKRIIVNNNGQEEIFNKIRESNLDNSKVSRKLGFHESYLSQIKNNKKRKKVTLPRNKLIKLCDLVNIDHSSNNFIESVFYPNDITIPFAEFLGNYWGDGSFGNKLHITEANLESLKYYENIVKNLFKVNTSISHQKNKYVLNIHSSYLNEFIRNLGLNYSRYRKIPKKILKSDNNVISAFIRGFYDAESNVRITNRNNQEIYTIHLTSSSKEMTEQIKLLLLRFGVISTIIHRRRYDKRFNTHSNISELRIGDIRSIINFFNYINFNHPQKKSKLDYVMSKIKINKAGINFRYEVDLVPKLFKLMKIPQYDLLKKYNIRSNEFFNHKYNIPLETLKLINKFLQEEYLRIKNIEINEDNLKPFAKRFLDSISLRYKSYYYFYKELETNPKKIKKEVREEIDKIIIDSKPILDKLNKIVESSNSFTFDEVYRIEKINEKLVFYDLVVEDNHNFIANGIFTHNSYSHETMKNIKDGNKKHVDISCFCSGTPENITNKRLKEGILRRFSPLVLTLTKKEHLEVLNYQNNGLGKQGDYVDSSPIHKFYEELFKIQMNQNKEIPPIVDYIFPDTIKLKASSFFNPVGAKLHEIYGVNTATENEEFFRFMVCSAFLRIFEKKKNNMIQDNHLIIDDKDLEIANKLIKNEMSTKNYIYYSIDRIDLDGVNTRKALKLWTEQRAKSGLKELPEEVNFLMKSNLRK